MAGPTGVGKTAVSLHLAKLLDAEIVCCDSRQLFRGLDLATGKPTVAERRVVPHHLFDAWEPTERASAGRYRRLAAACLAPGLDRTVLVATLSDLREALLYLHYTGRRYRFEPHPNLNKLIADEAIKYGAEEIRRG